MNANQILFPVISMLLLTTCIGLLMGYLRVRAVDKGELRISYFRHNSGSEISTILARVSDNYDNLITSPMMFYVVVIMLYISGNINQLQLILAWGFVATRLLHSFIHITTNNVIHRSASFLGGVMIVTAMWILLVIEII